MTKWVFGATSMMNRTPWRRLRCGLRTCRVAIHTLMCERAHRLLLTLGRDRAGFLLARHQRLDAEATDPAVERRREVAEPTARHAQERIDFMWRQLDPERETGPGRIQEEVTTERVIREQATERPFHIPLAHMSSCRAFGARKDRTNVGHA
jgi:hypothetical protein